MVAVLILGAVSLSHFTWASVSGEARITNLVTIIQKSLVFSPNVIRTGEAFMSNSALLGLSSKRERQLWPAILFYGFDELLP